MHSALSVLSEAVSRQAAAALVYPTNGLGAGDEKIRKKITLSTTVTPCQYTHPLNTHALSIHNPPSHLPSHTLSTPRTNISSSPHPPGDENNEDEDEDGDGQTVDRSSNAKHINQGLIQACHLLHDLATSFDLKVQAFTAALSVYLHSDPLPTTTTTAATAAAATGATGASGVGGSIKGGVSVKEEGGVQTGSGSGSGSSGGSGSGSGSGSGNGLHCDLCLFDLLHRGRFLPMLAALAALSRTATEMATLCAWQTSQRLQVIADAETCRQGLVTLTSALVFLSHGSYPAHTQVDTRSYSNLILSCPILS